MADIDRAGTVKVPEDYDRDKLNLGTPEWNDGHRILLYPGDTAEVDLTDPMIKHYIDGGDLKLIEQETGEDGKTFQDRVEELPGIGNSRAETVVDDYETWTAFTEEVTAEYLTEEVGVGASKADEILEKLEDTKEEE